MMSIKGIYPSFPFFRVDNVIKVDLFMEFFMCETSRINNVIYMNWFMIYLFFMSTAEGK